MKETILLIEDEKIMRVTIEDALTAAGYEVSSFETGAEALKAFEGADFSLVVTDVRLPDMSGLDILRGIMRMNTAQVIVMTAFGTIKDAVEAMRLGAFDYITKPFSLDEFLLLVERSLEVKKLKEENVRLKRDLDRCYNFPNIIGKSEAMKGVFAMIERVAASDATVLILGESGTGKELVATTIHYQSKRKDKPLIKVNCAALPESLIESELFGYEKGAFTGAMKRKPGRFELANGGTIFLDEIGDIPVSTQAKLLRSIQERTFERVGGVETINADVRVLAATNKDLEEEVRQGAFREDLYYRLNVIPVTMPPLRERKEDIPLFINFFLERYCSGTSRNIRISKEALDALLNYDYPGNIRELENIIERCVTLCASDVIGKDDLPPGISAQTGGVKKHALSAVAAEAEREYIVRILKSTGNNKTRAAEMLGISRKTLWEKMKAYGIE
ncbi:MAG: sigma-54-dependent Fis family transcriptional regulator [Nitrospirae bacterium]|nr:MAG: sigma-54-dependent Fis family transcriptional regulator [Nitrospirota bacterium]